MTDDGATSLRSLQLLLLLAGLPPQLQILSVGTAGAHFSSSAVRVAVAAVVAVVVVLDSEVSCYTIYAPETGNPSC